MPTTSTRCETEPGVGLYARAGACLPALLAVALGAPRLAAAHFCLDDTYIHLAYVRSLKLGEGLSYNPHDWATGVTSPLWVLLLAAWPFGVPGAFAIKLLGLGLHALSAQLTTRLAYRLSSNEAAPSQAHRAGLIAGALWAATPLAVQGATSGMEVTLASCLALAFSGALLERRYWLAAGLAMAGYGVRPELIVYVALVTLCLTVQRRELAAGLPLAASLIAAATCAFYYQRVSGHPFPNTYYVKGRGFDLGQLRYWAEEVLLRQPVVCSGFGLGLGLLALWRAWQRRALPLLALSFAAFATMLAIAGSRALYPGVTFAQSRYFVPLLWILPLLAGSGVNALATRWAAPTALALAGLSIALCVRGGALQTRQEAGIMRLHIEPAQFVTAQLPPGSVLGVEGAGALRYFTPRSLRVIDIVGLNDDQLAHMRGDKLARLCHLRAQKMSHVAYPEPWLAFLSRGFQLRTLARFREASYAQIDPPQDWTVVVAKVERVKADFARACELRQRANP